MRTRLEKAGVIEGPGLYRRARGHRSQGVARREQPDRVVGPGRIGNTVQKQLMRRVDVLGVGGGSGGDGLGGLALQVTEQSQRVGGKGMPLPRVP